MVKEEALKPIPCRVDWLSYSWISQPHFLNGIFPATVIAWVASNDHVAQIPASTSGVRQQMVILCIHGIESYMVYNEWRSPWYYTWIEAYQTISDLFSKNGYSAEPAMESVTPEETEFVFR
jgi:hypothetical protein